MERETACAPVAVPDGMAADLAGYAWARDTIGESGAAVYRLSGAAGGAELFLKHGHGEAADDVTDEMVRLGWLAPHLPVPAVRHFVRTANDAWLLTEAMPGHTAFQLLADEPDSRAQVVDALGGFLRRLHAIPIDLCPFTSAHPHRLALARARIDAGLVAEDEFDDEREGWTAEEVWAAMQALLPLTPDPVVTHGDFSLDNIFVSDGQVVGCIDAGRVGIADRYQDLAILWNCLGEFGGGLQDRLIAAYGLAQVDRRKLDFHLMLDEMF